MKMVARTCPLCKSTETSKKIAESNLNTESLNEFSFSSRKLPDFMHHRLFLCTDCDLIYSNPIPDTDNLEKEYSNADFDSAQEAQFASQTYAKFLPEIIKKIPGLDGALDVGTGNGAFLEKLIEKGFTNVIGIEPSKAPVMAAKKNIRPMIKQAFFEPAHFQDDRFNLISCFQTIEHLTDPLQMCRNFHDKLKIGGAVLLICHNHCSLSSKLLGMKSPIIDIEHLQLFSPKSMKILLQRSGFVNVKIKIVLNRYSLHYWIKLFPLPTKLKLFIMAASKMIGVGYLPLSIPAGNIATIGYKE